MVVDRWLVVGFDALCGQPRWFSGVQEGNNDLTGDSSHRLRRGGFDDETLRREALQIHGHIRDVCRNEIKHEIAAVGDRIGEAMVSVFSDLESSIRNDIARME
nr:exocyst complex component EXO70B1-like isoform X1 [Ipomoea trifida]